MIPPAGDEGARAAPRVLVADDDADILALLAAGLERRGYAVTTATDGSAALALTTAELPDALVLDWLMPGLEGAEVCRELRSQAATASIPVVLLTARAAEADRRRALDAGASAYVVKPFSIAELDRTLRDLIEPAG